MMKLSFKQLEKLSGRRREFTPEEREEILLECERRIQRDLQAKLREARAEIKRLRAFVPPPELMARLAALDEDYANRVDEGYFQYIEETNHGSPSP